MSSDAHDEEERDLIDMDSADLRAMPLYLTSPERIGLAIGDELEDWNSEFGDCEAGVTWYSEAWGAPPVQVSIDYVRADLYDAQSAELAGASRIAAEYLEAKRVIDAGPPRPEGSFAPPRPWRHNDPAVIRWHKAVAALNELASKVKPS